MPFIYFRRMNMMTQGAEKFKTFENGADKIVDFRVKTIEKIKCGYLNQ